jgi:lipopolysaccharide export LptBFGC system permease protein LptF
MTSNVLLRRMLLPAMLVVVFAAGMIIGQNKFGQPKTVIHLVTLKWKATSTPAQQQAAIEGIKGMAAKIPGIKNIWIKPVRIQPQGNQANFAIEFADEAAAKVYADHPAHAEWNKIYLEAREESNSNQVTN